MLHFWQNFVYPFFNSTFFLSLVTFMVGLIALFIYWRQHGDEKKDAAQTIFNEIVSAENKLNGIRERFFAVQYPSLEGVTIMNHENWSKYKYLFVNDLDESEWSTIDSFYSNCKDYDEAVVLNNSYFHEDTKHIFDAIYSYYSKKIEQFHSRNSRNTSLPQTSINDIKSHFDAFIGNIVPSGTAYRPQKPVDDARVALVALDTSVSLSSAGQKIKKIAKIH